ncbi:MAG: acyl-CoA dehydrogenase family protein [Candidatus Methylomirabilia bacterium]
MAAIALADQDPQIVTLVREFVEKEVKPVASALEHDDIYPHDLVARMKELGLFGCLIPKAFGGLGLTSTAYALVIEELCRGWMSLAGVINSHLIMALIVTDFGTEEQRERFLPAMARGDKRGGLCLTEPHAGSDVQAIRTVARRQGEAYRITGTKMFVTNGREGNTFALLARTDPAASPPHRGMSCFIVEKGHPGFQVAQSLSKLGYKGLDTVELVFEDVSVPADNLVGGVEGRGFKHVMAGLETGRINIAARAVGVAQAAFEDALRYAQLRPPSDHSGAGRQAIQLRLADMVTELSAARLLATWAAKKKDAGQRCDLEAGMAKLFASEAAQEIAMDSMRIHGGHGSLKEYRVERYYRDTPLMIIGEGTNEIQRLVIARQLLERYGERHGALHALEGEPVERRQLVQLVRTFVEKDVIPLASRYERADEDPFEIVEKLRELGLLGATIPQEYGGLGLDSTTCAMLLEEISRGWMSLSAILTAHLSLAAIVTRSGTEAQRRRFLPALATGDKLGGLALSEASGGPDLQAVRTVARRDGDSYVITGSQMFVTNGRHGAIFALLAKTDPEAGSPESGLSCFIVEKGGPGLTVSRDLAMLGFRGLRTCEMILEEFRVPAGNLVGEREGEGFAVVMAGTESDEIAIAARGVGVAQAAFEAALRYSQQRSAFGKPICQHQAIQLKLADMGTRLTAARLLTLRAAEKRDAGEGASLEAGMAKLFASEMAYEVALDAMRIHGGYGYITDFPVERYYRDAPLLVVGEGSTELLRLRITHQLLTTHSA